MQIGFWPRIRHPFFPGLTPVPAGEAKAYNAALYGSVAELLRAAGEGVTVKRAVFVTQFENGPLLNEQDRDLLWDKFGVPVFVLLLDRTQRVMAFECEAQSGLHINGRYQSASAETPLCGCGRPGNKVYPAAAELPLRPVAS